jgi:hypothetical protein
MVLGLIGVGSALVVLVRLRGRPERLGEQVDRVAPNRLMGATVGAEGPDR